MCIKGFSPSVSERLVLCFPVCNLRVHWIQNSPGDTKTPLATSLHARDGTQVISLLGAEVQELFGDLCCYGMVAVVGSRHFAVAIPQKACHGLGGVQSQRLLEDIQALAHCSGGVVVVVERLLLLLGCESECEKAEKQSQECDDVHQLFGVVREVIACADEYMSSSPQ